MKQFFQTDKGPLLVLALLGIGYFMGIGQFHLFDWDEINFAECAREMIVSGNYTLVQMDFMPFWEKPPFFFWLQAVAMHLFGVGEFAARLPNAFIGLVTLFTLYFIGKKHYSRKHGFLWACLYAGALLPHFYFKSGIIDPVFNYFIFMGVYCFVCYVSQLHKNRNALLCGLFIGLAVLTKGPVGLLLFGLTAGFYFLLKKFKGFPSIGHIGLFTLVFVAVILSWWGVDIANNGFAVVGDFIDYQIRLLTTPDAGHQQPFFYHFVVVFIGCFPLSIFALKGLLRPHNDALQFGLWMKILLWVVLGVFTIVTTKIIHYSSMAYLPLSYLAARAIYENKTSLPKWLTGMYLGFGLFWGALLTVIPFILPNKAIMKKLLANDQFAANSFLQNVEWHGYEFIGGIVLLASIVTSWLLYRKGEVFKAALVNATGLSVTFIFLAYAVLPKVEQYVQGPAIAFYKQAADKDVYLDVAGFKSYGRAFYSKKQPQKNNQRHSLDWLVNSNEVDKKVMIVTKSTDNRYENHRNLQLKTQKGGFKLYIREIPD